MITDQTKTKSGCLWAVIVVQFLMLVMAAFIVVGLAAVGQSFNKPIKARGHGVDEYPHLTEVWSSGKGGNKVARIPLRGMIHFGEEDSFLSYRQSSTMLSLKAIKRASNDSNVKAIILDVDSGGGGITASDILYKALLDFKRKDEERKVISIFGDVAASGAYYVAMASDKVIAHPTTITGSIGVLIQSINMRKLGEKIGIEDVTIKSGSNKDLLNPFGNMTSAQTNMLQNIVNEMHSQFVAVVSTGRNMTEEKVREIATGEIFTASKAQSIGLIDSVGYWEDAVQTTAELLGASKDEIKVYRYEQEFTIASFLKAQTSISPISKLLMKPTETRLLYLWEL